MMLTKLKSFISNLSSNIVKAELILIGLGLGYLVVSLLWNSFVNWLFNVK